MSEGGRKMEKKNAWRLAALVFVAALAMGLLLSKGNWGKASNATSAAVTSPTTLAPGMADFARTFQANSPRPKYDDATRKAFYDASLQYAKCMQANGAATFPDPDPNYGDGVTPLPNFIVPTGTDAGAAEVQSAFGTCKPEQDTMAAAVSGANAQG